MYDKRILVIGAGLSSPVLIDYLLKNAAVYNWELVVADMDIELANKRIDANKRARAVFFNVLDEPGIPALLTGFDLVISMLPAILHTKVTETCLELGINMITASYNPANAAEYHKKAVENDILILNEVGLDPGIDHMSAMKIINEVKEKGGQIVSFRSSTGGLVAPSSDNNPWNYKFSWNPANVVKAGQNGAQYIEHNIYKYIPYHQLFKWTENIEIAGYGAFETYANRDSLKYRKDYGLDNIPTMYRGTIRKPGFAAAWDALVQLGWTNDSFQIEDLPALTYKEITRSFVKENSENIHADVARYLQTEENSVIMSKLEWLGLFSELKTNMEKGTPAAVLQKLLMQKWALAPGDRDMIVMQHQVCYKMAQKIRKITSTLVIEGKDPNYTAMALTVGLPVAICAKMLLTGKITAKGVVIPTAKYIYQPVLEELETYGIAFRENEELL